jgi:uncharacterized 2Fe-2S/4Fe-4S cluster protein (DUF4445 family)
VPALTSKPKTALLGHGRQVVLAPSLRKRHLVLPPPTFEDQRGDLLPLSQALRDLELEVPLTALRCLPVVLRSAAFELTAVVGGHHLVAIEPSDTSAQCLGLALDLGTTTIAAALIDLTSGEIVALGSALNDQERFGSDVISRITLAMEMKTGATKLRRTVLASINGPLVQLLGSTSLSGERVYHAIIAGNSTMLHLLLAVDPAAFALARLRQRSPNRSIWPPTRLASRSTRKLASRPFRSSEPTSGATSAPAGLAFEGAEIRCGMLATDGAIEAIRMGETMELDIIGDGLEARGICGSGLADAVAGLLRTRLLDSSDRLKRRDEVPDHPLCARLVTIDGMPAFRLAEGVELTLLDLRTLQNAKDAMAAGVQILLAKAGLKAEQVDEVLLAGSFGTYIDPASARALGLAPPIDLERVIASGSSSLEGAKMALLSLREEQLGNGLAMRIEYVELSGRADLTPTFTDSLAFPVPGTVT